MARTAIVIALLLVAAPAAAQDGAIELEVGAREARAIDVDALRTALARELGMEVLRVDHQAPSAPRIRVRAIGRTRAVLELRRPDGSRLQRSTELDRDPGERLETIVILAVNMVRDEASELLELLRRRRGDRAGDADGASGAPETAAETDAGGEAASESVPEAVAVDGETAPETPVAAVIESVPAVSATEAPSPTVVAVTESPTPDTESAAIDAPADGAPAVPSAPVTTTAPAAVPTTPSTSREVPPASPESPRAPGQRVVRMALGALIGSVPRGAGHEATMLGFLELAWTPTDFLAFGLRDLGAGALFSADRWWAGGALFAELGWILDPALVLQLELGADVRVLGVGDAEARVGVAPVAVIGARIFPIREFSIALQTALHVVATDAWSTNLHMLPVGAVLWTGGISFAVHIS